MSGYRRVEHANLQLYDLVAVYGTFLLWRFRFAPSNDNTTEPPVLSKSCDARNLRQVRSKIWSGALARSQSVSGCLASGKSIPLSPSFSELELVEQHATAWQETE